MLCITGDTAHFCDNIKSGFYHFKGLTVQCPSIPLPSNGKNTRRSNIGHFATGRSPVHRVVGVDSVHENPFFRCFLQTTCGRKKPSFFLSARKFPLQRRYSTSLMSLDGRKRSMGQNGPLRESWVPWFAWSDLGFGCGLRMGMSSASLSTTYNYLRTPCHGPTCSSELPLGVLRTMPGPRSVLMGIPFERPGHAEARVRTMSGPCTRSAAARITVLAVRRVPPYPAPQPASPNNHAQTLSFSNYLMLFRRAGSHSVEPTSQSKACWWGGMRRGRGSSQPVWPSSTHLAGSRQQGGPGCWGWQRFGLRRR